jgi:hypothetical protein
MMPSHIEQTPAGVIDWKAEALRTARLLADAERIIAEYKAQAIEAARGVAQTPLAWLAEHTNYELSFSRWDDDPAWLLHSVNGGRNDRFWTLLASGDTPEAALRKAMALSGQTTPIQPDGFINDYD